ncbi:hypothetical protein YW7DRAFT_04614 [Streptomyces sp. AmelKG-E11A]|nr:hypothetical protein YW7DRAFT_04614 [Streptomyces sp. AmelKG-E11A]
MCKAIYENTSQMRAAMLYATGFAGRGRRYATAS